MTEDRAAKLLLLETLSEMCERCRPGTAVILIYNILLGRDPDPDGAAFYGARLDGSSAQRIGALRELATSDEARRYGLFSLNPALDGIDVDAVHLPEDPLGVLAMLGLMRRRMIETMERLDNIESLARITLLSVPEWCGSAYADLERRIAGLETALMPKRAQFR
jgi:Domain of unknown function (DUF4214)